MGTPSEPGSLRVASMGDVQVTADDIARAEAHPGDPVFELIDVTAIKDDCRRYRLGHIRSDV